MEEAEKISTHLLQEKMIACVNFFSNKKFLSMERKYWKLGRNCLSFKNQKW